MGRAIVLMSLVVRFCSWVVCEEAETKVIMLEQRMTWGDGLRGCHDRNGSLLTQKEVESEDWQTLFNSDQSEEEFWTGMHQYQSDWLGAIGWVSDISVRNVAGSTFEMDVSSPGACQEWCQTPLYAIENGSTCICIPASGNQVFPIYTVQVSSWRRCDNSETPNTCGGKRFDLDIASLYGDVNYLGVSVRETDGHCATARCSSASGSPIVQGFDCQTNFYSVCEQSTEQNFSPWDQAYEKCLNISLLSASRISQCLTFAQYPRGTQTNYWVGLKRQNYTRSDKGEVNIEAVQKCQSCNTSGNCEFQTECQSVQKLVPCKVPASETPAPTSQTVYVDATTSSEKSTREIILSVKTPENHFPLLLVLFAAIGGALVILLLVISAVVCVRLRSSRKRKRADNSVPKGNAATAQRQNTDDLNLENVSPRGHIDTDKDTYERIEGSRNSMNEKDTDSKSDNQNIYHHLRAERGQADESESNMYDVSGRDVPNAEEIYNHLREGSTSSVLMSENVYDVGGCSGGEDPGIYNHLHGDCLVQNSDSSYNMYGVN